MWIATLILLRCCRELPTKVLFKRRADFQILRIRDLDSGQISDLMPAFVCLLMLDGRLHVLVGKILRKNASATAALDSLTEIKITISFSRTESYFTTAGSISLLSRMNLFQLQRIQFNV